MNPRIQELANEAAKFSAIMALPTGESGDKLFVEKFAELIVRECADLFEVEWGEEKLTGNDVGYVVKKHFGVE